MIHTSPVIDQRAGVMYLVTHTTGKRQPVYRLHMLDHRQPPINSQNAELSLLSNASETSDLRQCRSAGTQDVHPRTCRVHLASDDGTGRRQRCARLAGEGIFNEVVEVISEKPSRSERATLFFTRRRVPTNKANVLFVTL
jgi:hypothetical protein